MKNEELRMENSAAAVGLCKFFCATLFFIFLFSFFSLKAQDSVLVVKLPDGLRFEMVYVQGGSYMMGTDVREQKYSYEASRPRHEVSVDDFYIGRHEVTQALWVAVMGANPSRFQGNDSLPVTNITWDDARHFITRLSQMTGFRFRMPTEAEWEYAARGGVKVKGERLKVKGEEEPYAGCDRSQLHEYAWFCVNSEHTIHAVGRLLPNELGLYDMSGNVAEWCSDWMAPYEADAVKNPRGPRNGDSRILRGGHYNSVSAACAVFDRGWYVPSGTNEFYGLRLVMEIGEE